MKKKMRTIKSILKLDKPRELLPKDLLNDLEREEFVKERIKKQLEKYIDSPVLMTTNMPSEVWSSTAASFSIPFLGTSSCSPPVSVLITPTFTTTREWNRTYNPFALIKGTVDGGDT